MSALEDSMALALRLEKASAAYVLASANWIMGKGTSLDLGRAAAEFARAIEATSGLLAEWRGDA